MREGKFFMFNFFPQKLHLKSVLWHIIVFSFISVSSIKMFPVIHSLTQINQLFSSTVRFIDPSAAGCPPTPAVFVFLSVVIGWGECDKTTALPFVAFLTAN